MKRIAGLILAVCLLLSGCGTDPAAVQISRPKQVLTVYSPLAESVYQPFVREFQQRTGIWVSVESGDSEQLLEQFRQEPEQCDVLFGFAPQILAELEGEISWETVFQSVPVIVCNPHLIRKNPPEDFLDLTDPRWQGSICIPDPEKTWISLAVLSLLEEAQGSAAGIAENLSMTADSSAQALELVRDGTCAVGIAWEAEALEAVNQGADLSVIYPKDRCVLFSAAAAISPQAMEPEAAREFLAFLQEEQTRSFAWEQLHLRTEKMGAEERSPAVRDHADESDAFRSRILALWKEVSGR